MKLIVGLGNPGREYQNTRHNAGFMVVDRLIERHAPGVPAKSKWSAALYEAALPGAGKAVLMKPITYMNLSGGPVADAVRFYKLEPMDLLVVTDDVALEPGVIRLRASGGAGGHNGLKHINQRLGTEGYPRLRVGIGQSPSFMDQADYVLGKFTDAELSVINPALDRAADAALVFCAEGPEAAMNKFNAPASGWGSKSSEENNEKKPEPDEPTGIDPGWLGKN